MNRLKRSFLSLVLVVSISAGLLCGVTVYAEEPELTSEQQNALAMLNYITVLTQEINASKNSRVYMEEAYSTLINNTYPNAVDSRTLNQMTGLLDTMENYRMVNVKRERLQYVYEQSQAQAIRAAIPNPLGLISTVHSFNPAKLVASIVYMAIDSYASYTAYTAAAEQQFLKDGWALDDEEAKVLHESRKGTFSYMVKMVNDNNLPGDLTLTEDTVSEFVRYKNNSNLVSRIQFLESNKRTYQSYGGYWLALADSYYNNGDYQKCVDAVTTYEQMGTRIFRRDYELAKVLPLAIAAANEIYGIGQYAPYAAKWAQVIIDNTNHDDWALRYFAAQTLVDLYANTRDKIYLQNAYKIITDNVNYLVGEQLTLNDNYKAKVQEVKVTKGADKEEKKQIENYNKMLKETRKTELPPAYEPLMLNCDLLFAIADELKIADTEKSRIDRMLHPNGDRLFLTRTIDDQYWFDTSNAVSKEEINIDFGGTVMIIPASYLTKDSHITVTVTEAGETNPVVIKDWKIDRVERGEEGDISSFEAAYVSADAKKYSWVPESQVKIEIQPKEGTDILYKAEYLTEGTKNAWYDYLKVWEGHKNNWYDYAKVWENSVKFVRVK